MFNGIIYEFIVRKSRFEMENRPLIYTQAENGLRKSKNV